jgi:AcrR family transcriptional regulator
MTTDSSRPPKTRDRILDAAREVLADEGLSGFTMSEVERRVGLAVGSGSIYRHYASKEALLQAVLEQEVRVNRAATEATRQAAQQLSDATERDERVYKQMLDDLRRFNRFFALMLDQGDRNPELRSAVQAALHPDTNGETAAEEPLETFAMAALGGYHLFSIMQGQPFNGIEEEPFLRMLVQLVHGSGSARRSASRNGRRRTSEVRP